jgi:hypothetical protein
MGRRWKKVALFDSSFGGGMRRKDTHARSKEAACRGGQVCWLQELDRARTRSQASNCPAAIYKGNLPCVLKRSSYAWIWNAVGSLPKVPRLVPHCLLAPVFAPEPFETVVGASFRFGLRAMVRIPPEISHGLRLRRVLHMAVPTLLSSPEVPPRRMGKSV